MKEQAPSEAEVNEYVRRFFAGQEGKEFSPVLLYDGELDAIRVLVVDTSVTEVLVTPALTLCKRTHSDEDGFIHVGFVVEGARIFCQEYGLPHQGTVSMVDILNLVMKIEPGSKAAVLDVAMPMVALNGLLTVDFPT